jgi:hypothetical protein
MPIENDDELPELSCDSCGEVLDPDDVLHTSTEKMSCNDCYRMCEHCEWSGTTDDSWYTVDDSLWCEGCWENDAFTCERCEENYNGNRTGSRYIYQIGTWCEYCTDNDASYCDDCDEYYPDEQGCARCGDTIGKVHQYSYKPNPVFHGQEPNGLFMGFELEMSLGRVENAIFHNATAGVLPLENDKVCYLKSDASIGDMGFELVTHPHTLGAYEQATDLWAYIESLRSNFGARSWDTDTCGLHVHVSRAAFKSGAHTHRFLTLIYKNPKEMMKLAGRKNSRYAQFSDVYKPDEWGVPQFTLRDKIHGRGFTERYSAVNTQNDYTLELRFFRGTMAKSGILAALELTHAATEYTRNMTVSDVKLGMLKWEWFASWVESNNGLYPNLYVRMAKVPSVSLDNREMLNA